MTVEVGIRGLGVSVPERVLTNAELERMVDTSDTWIRERTGIVERRLVPPGVNASHLACAAGRQAVAASGVPGAELAFVINSTGTADLSCPSVAARVGAAVGIGHGFCFDLNAACSGFVYALTVGASLLRTQGAAQGLVVASEQVSGLVDYRDRSSCILFGDGAGAAVLTAAPPHHRLLHTELGADPSGAEVITMGGQEGFSTRDRHFFREDGRRVFRFGISTLERYVRKGLEVARVGPGDRFHVVPHQANLRMIQHVAERMDLPADRFVTNVARRGNTSSASIPVAMAEAAAEGRFQPGDKLILVAFGGGLTWGLAVIEW